MIMIDFEKLDKELNESLLRLRKLEKQANIRMWVITALLVLYVGGAIYVHFIK